MASSAPLVLPPLPEVERLSPAVIRILGGNPGKVETSLSFLLLFSSLFLCFFFFCLFLVLMRKASLKKRGEGGGELKEGQKEI